MLSPKELQALVDTISDPDERYWNGVLYGEFGTRKTTTGLRTSRKRAILLHADRGWNVYQNHPEEFKSENIIPLKYEGLAQVRAIVEAVVENQEPFNDVDLIQLDTVSQMQENYIDWLGENFVIFGREKATPKPGVKEQEVALTGLPDYHLTRNKMRPVIELLVNAPVNTLFLAHVREPNAMEKQAGKLERRPNLTEAVYKIVARDAQFIGYMQREGDKYTVDFTPKKTQSAKSQIPALTDKKINTDDLPKILWAWQDGEN